MLTYMYVEDCWSLFTLAFQCFTTSLTKYDEFLMLNYIHQLIIQMYCNSKHNTSHITDKNTTPKTRG
jgi:hypothetical protein